MKKQTKPNITKAVKPSVPGEWLYLAPEGTTVRKIAENVEGAGEIELWEEVGVLEIPIGESSSVDIEQAQVHPKDELTQSYVTESGYKEVFLVTFAPEEYEQAKGVMQQILAKCGGLFCGDTEDFMPVIRA